MEKIIENSLRNIVVDRYPELFSVEVTEMMDGFMSPFYQINYTTTEEIDTRLKRQIIIDTQDIYGMFDMKKRSYSSMPELVIKFKVQ